ncbi:hypothetical protein MATL_G00174920 [Megalops atlanticus]|uniref:Uncharacterized protein n=1 Tax=Megalops atlanticus TaxID=7932 RepID=A0A9D3T7H1_MEGAT|nr:hypothetical protein MATL_G00174920 [Megalops atlanticus]
MPHLQLTPGSSRGTDTQRTKNFAKQEFLWFRPGPRRVRGDLRDSGQLRALHSAPGCSCPNQSVPMLEKRTVTFDPCVSVRSLCHSSPFPLPHCFAQELWNGVGSSSALRVGGRWTPPAGTRTLFWREKPGRRGAR